MTEYWLGIDLGTTYTAAAISRPNGTTEMLGLGTRSLMIPSVVLVRDDGEILVGEAAERRAATEPSRVAREFKRRLGDPSPLFLGGTPFTAESLMGHVLRHVLDRAREREGVSPAGTVITHPASWSPFKIDLLRDAIRQAGINGATLMTEPEAAALHYGGLQRVSAGETVAVYDFGGGTFDSAALTATPEGFALIGTPEGIERLGGIDFDQAVLAHINGALGGALSDLDPSDPADSAALAEIRDNCRAAKEALSEDTDTTITVNLPGRPSTQLRMTRSEFEDLISPRIDETVEALERTIASSGRSTADVSRILPVGGSSRIPLVHQRIREATGLPLSFDTDPNLAIAQGAAALARQVGTNERAVRDGAAAVSAPTVPQAAAAATSSVGEAAIQTPPNTSQTLAAATSPTAKNRKPLILAGTVAVLAVIGVIAALSSGGDKEETATRSSATKSGAPTVPVEVNGGEETSPASTTTTTTTQPVSGKVVDYTEANGRSTRLGGFEWKVEGVTVGGVADVGGRVSPAVTVDLLANNLTDGDLIAVEKPLMRFGEDPVEVKGVQKGVFSTASSGASVRVTYAFNLPPGLEANESALDGALLIFQGNKVLRAGIRLDGEVAAPPVISAFPINASVSIEGNSYGNLAVTSVRPALDADKSVANGGGDNGDDDFRALTDNVWLAFDVRLDCRGGPMGTGCGFGLDEDVIRVEIDGVAEGFESNDSSLFELDPGLSAGASAQLRPQLMVKRGASYALLLGDPKNPAAVQRVPLDIAPAVDSLYASIADFQA